MGLGLGRLDGRSYEDPAGELVAQSGICLLNFPALGNATSDDLVDLDEVVFPELRPARPQEAELVFLLWPFAPEQVTQVAPHVAAQTFLALAALHELSVDLSIEPGSAYPTTGGWSGDLHRYLLETLVDPRMLIEYYKSIG